MDFLKEFHIINSSIGLIHTIFAILSMVFGTMVLLNKKGTKKHKRVGYYYVISMLIVNVTAFMIYNFGRISMFHFFAAASLITTIIGVLAAIRKKKNWLRKHFYFMSWSVVGLYCAFWAEIGVRFFEMKYFWWIVMLATGLTSWLGARRINKEAKKMKFDK
ncbi:DUF2306 domain-containing protein [Polaribacter porphyrae]|uniref:DUF2306 domain-containing protein n=1 Tax=Polaribacter porphyrae TaxID=1137780 RepID=A0A2S7WNU1_9FLAO|nr:DUF2306 domain-containing protein [Polaribacter porphyrae]PQJ79277.1 hypothetical protein BTO18_08870 [Polaribacter porphyrae]